MVAGPDGVPVRPRLFARACCTAMLRHAGKPRSPQLQLATGICTLQSGSNESGSRRFERSTGPRTRETFGLPRDQDPSAHLSQVPNQTLHGTAAGSVLGFAWCMLAPAADSELTR